MSADNEAVREVWAVVGRLRWLSSAYADVRGLVQSGRLSKSDGEQLRLALGLVKHALRTDEQARAPEALAMLNHMGIAMKLDQMDIDAAQLAAVTGEPES